MAPKESAKINSYTAKLLDPEGRKKSFVSFAFLRGRIPPFAFLRGGIPPFAFAAQVSNSGVLVHPH